MGEAARAVGPTRSVAKVRPLKPDLGHVLDVMQDLANEQARFADDQAKHGVKLDDLIEVVGKPGTPDGGQPATGIFAHLNAHDRRLKKFERLWERGMGFAVGAGPLLIALWWLAGDKIAKLLH